MKTLVRSLLVKISGYLARALHDKQMPYRKKFEWFSLLSPGTSYLYTNSATRMKLGK